MKAYIEHPFGLRSIILAWCYLFAALSAPCAAAAPGLRQQVGAQKGYFLIAYANSFESNSQNAAWLRAFLDDADRAAARPAQDWTRALRRLVSLGKQEGVFFKSTGFVEDRKIVELLVAALSEPDADTRDVALKSLAHATRQTDLEHFSDSIRSALAALPPDEGLLVLGKLPLTSGEQLQVRARAGAQLEIRARLGDTDAEQELIRQFTQESDYYAKKSLAQRLGYAGTLKCVQALVEGLRSSVSSNGLYDDRSIRCDILLALGQIYQDEPLFTRDACLLADNDDQTFNRNRGIDKYCKAVNEWVQQRIGHPAWNPEEVWFVRWHQVPVVRPTSK